MNIQLIHVWPENISKCLLTRNNTIGRKITSNFVSDFVRKLQMAECLTAWKDLKTYVLQISRPFHIYTTSTELGQVSVVLPG